MPKPEIFVGLTTWNSEIFLPACLRGLQKTLEGIRSRIVIFDNSSTDRTPVIAREHGIEVITGLGSQPYALNVLIGKSTGRYTLLIHSDVVLLNRRWAPLCISAVEGGHALVSPEDIGFGPWTRPWGRGMPESSFMFWSTQALRSCREWCLATNNRWRLPLPRRTLDLSQAHVTHGLPRRLATKGMTWRAMKVHASPLQDARWAPPFHAKHWRAEWGSYRYAFGNFYSLDGEITHYHNWYDRVSKNVRPDSTETCNPNGEGIPLAFIAHGTRNFLADYQSGQLLLPDPHEITPEPHAL